jgi:hypothetical protein
MDELRYESLQLGIDPPELVTDLTVDPAAPRSP